MKGGYESSAVSYFDGALMASLMAWHVAGRAQSEAWLSNARS